MSLLVCNWHARFLSTVREREDIGGLEYTALKFSFVARTWSWRVDVWVCWVDALQVAAFAVGTIIAVGAINGVKEGIETPGVGIVEEILVVDIVNVPNSDGLRID